MNNFFAVLKKELLDISRDRKALLVAVLLPIILYPIMFKFISSTADNIQKDVEKQINIAIEGDYNSSISTFLRDQSNIQLPKTEDNTKSLKNGDIQAIIVIPDDFDNRISTEKDSKIEILYDEDSNKSITAVQFISNIFEQYKQSIIESNLAANGLDTSILNPFQIESKSGLSATDDHTGLSSMLLGMLPSLLIIFMLSSTLAMATDLGAGEKEKSTFEPLLSTPANRMSILWAKIASLCVISLIALGANMIALTFSLNTFISDSESIGITLSSSTIIGIIIVAIFVLITLSALQMAISLYARSSKEAGTYLSGITFPVFILAYFPIMMDAKNLSTGLLNIPITNAVCLMKEFLVGIFDIKHIIIVLTWHIIYVIASILFAKFMFSREEVIFRT